MFKKSQEYFIGLYYFIEFEIFIKFITFIKYFNCKKYLREKIRLAYHEQFSALTQLYSQIH